MLSSEACKELESKYFSLLGLDAEATGHPSQHEATITDRREGRVAVIRKPGSECDPSSQTLGADASRVVTREEGMNLAKGNSTWMPPTPPRVGVMEEEPQVQLVHGFECQVQDLDSLPHTADVTSSQPCQLQSGTGSHPPTPRHPEIPHTCGTL